MAVGALMAAAVASAMRSAIAMAIAATTMRRNASLVQEGVVEVTVVAVTMPAAAVNATRSAMATRIAATIIMLSVLQELNRQEDARCRKE